jgi:hypothetical protein
LLTERMASLRRATFTAQTSFVDHKQFGH